MVFIMKTQWKNTYKTWKEIIDQRRNKIPNKYCIKLFRWKVMHTKTTTFVCPTYLSHCLIQWTLPYIAGSTHFNQIIRVMKFWGPIDKSQSLQLWYLYLILNTQKRKIKRNKEDSFHAKTKPKGSKYGMGQRAPCSLHVWKYVNP